MESIVILQTQSKLCHSEGKAKRKAPANPDAKELKRVRKILKRMYRELTSLEYVLDSTNQRRKRTDKAIKKAWGYAYSLKGQAMDALDYYQPTLMVYHYDGNRKEVNPTWTKRARKIYTICKTAQAVALNGGKET